MSTKTIQKLLSLFICHPFRSEINKTQAEAQEIVAEILIKAVLRITKEDTVGLIKHPIEYLQCFNQLCCDIARKAYSMTEADYQFLLSQYDLMQEPVIKVHYTYLKQGMASYDYNKKADELQSVSSLLPIDEPKNTNSADSD